MEKLWPESVAVHDFDGFEPDDSALIDEVVSMGRCMGFQLDSEDVHELLKSLKIELNTDCCNTCKRSMKPG